MSYNRLIHDYLDGELDQTGEEALFATLSENAELRHDFNMHVKLNNLALLDMQRITVPSDVTGAVFGRLGISAPGVGVITPATNKQQGLFRKYTGFLMLLLLLFMAGTSVYLLNENQSLKGLLGSFSGKQKAIPTTESYSDLNEFKSGIIKSSESDEATDLAKNSQNSLNNGESINNYTKSSSSVKSNRANNPVLNGLARNNSNDNSAKANSFEDSDGNFAQVMTITFGAYDNNFNPNGNSLDNVTKNKDRSYNSVNFGSVGNDGFVYNSANLYQLSLPVWSIQIRRMAAQNNYPPINVGDKTDFFTDNTIGVWYHFKRDLSFGIEGGSEIFSQEFTADNLNYNQAPLFNWYGASIRYNPKEWIMPYTLNPYIMQTVAYTKIGPLAKTQAGLTLSIFEPLTFFVGGEYSLLLYQSDGRLYNSGKFGYTAGININFR